MEATTVSCCSTIGQIKERLRTIVKDHARLNPSLDRLEDSTDLYRAGMSSQASVVLMIAVEGEFGLEFPDCMLSRDVFTNIDTIAQAIETVMQAGQ